jgi:hypothetical protein
MEKAVLDLPKNNAPWRVTVRGTLIGLVSLCVLLSVLGNGVGFLTWTHPCPHRPHESAAHTLHSTSDEFRLVEVHRMGVGPRRNQVYQTLAIAPSSPLHSLSSISDNTDNDGRYIIISHPGRTTHLSDRTRKSIKAYLHHSRLQAQSLRDTALLSSPQSLSTPQSPAAEWTTRDILLPNITNKNSVLTLAKVSSNAYIRIPDSEDWYDLGHKWNESTDFGWEENGLRGHVFANTDNSTIIVAMKGTSPPFVGGSDTSTNDKINVTTEIPSPAISREIPSPSSPLVLVSLFLYGFQISDTHSRTTYSSPAAAPVSPISGTQSATATPATPTNATKPA